MSHKARYVEGFNLGDVVSYQRHLCLIVSVQSDLFGCDFIGVYNPHDRSYKVVSSDKLLPTKYYFISDSISKDLDISNCIFVKPCSARYFYIGGLRHLDGWRDEVFHVKKVDRVRRMVYLVPLCRHRIGSWFTFSEFVHCFRSEKE